MPSAQTQGRFACTAELRQCLALRVIKHECKGSPHIDMKFWAVKVGCEERGMRSARLVGGGIERWVLDRLPLYRCAYLDFQLKAVQGLQRRRIHKGAVGRTRELDKQLGPTGHCLGDGFPPTTELEQYCVTSCVAIIHCDVILHVITL
jgi:hypothetical protein